MNSPVNLSDINPGQAIMMTDRGPVIIASHADTAIFIGGLPSPVEMAKGMPSYTITSSKAHGGPNAAVWLGDGKPAPYKKPFRRWKSRGR